MSQWKAGRSKSLPVNAIDPFALAKEFGADSLLSYLLRISTRPATPTFRASAFIRFMNPSLQVRQGNSKNLQLYVCWIAESSQFPPLRRLKVHSSVASCG